MINRSKIYLSLLLSGCFILSSCSKKLPPETLPSVTPVSTSETTVIIETEPSETTEETVQQVGPSSEPCGATLPVDVYGELNVYEKYLTDSEYRAVTLNGVCINSLNYSNGFINNETISTFVNDWGCDVLRFSMNVEEDVGGYTSDPESKFAEVCSVIDMCVDNGVYVIIDWNLVSGCDPREYEEQATDFFSRIAAIYSGVPNVIYEISGRASFNSERDDVWGEEIKPYALSVIDSIRQYDADNLIIVQTPYGGEDLEDVLNDPLMNDDVIYSISISGEYDESKAIELTEISDEGLPMICTDFKEFGEDGAFLSDAFTAYDEVLEADYISWCAYYAGGDAAPGNLINTDIMDDQAIVAAHWPDDYINDSGLFVRGELLSNASEREEYYQTRLEEDEEESDEEDTAESTQG